MKNSCPKTLIGIRRLLVALALCVAAAPSALLLTGTPAAAAPSLDVYSVKGSAAGIRITVQTGYSFVVEPDAMLPRAAATIEADQVNALASPLDPGDSVDALPGLGVPTAENDIQQSTTNGCCPAPLPALPLPTPPPQLGQNVNPLITTYVAPWNPVLTAPYEHAQASYPDPTRPGPQHAGFPVGSADAVPPDFPDLFGVISAHSSLGSVSAGPGSGVADSGVGSAVSIPAVGLSVGRISSHVEVHGGSGPATSSVVTTLHDVDLAPAGTALLHIGTLVLTATTTRDPATAHATSHTDLQASGVTVGSQSARLDQNGLSVNGSPSPLNPAAGMLIGMVSKDCQPGTPVDRGTNLVTVPTMRIGMPSLQDQSTHNGNEESVRMTGPTLCIAGSAPVPGNGGVAATPTIYTITLGDVSSSAYGIAFPAESTGAGTFLPPLPETGVGAPPGGTDTTTTTVNGAASAAQPAPPGGGGSPPTGLQHLLATLTGGILSPKVVVTVAGLAELALLATLWLSYRVSTARRPEDASPAQRMDLV